MKKLTIGILAHVDAGKTTLSEAMLYISGAIRTLGRVDHRDTFLDTYALERQRGITIFSKQAAIELPGIEIMLLDTPGHADFSAEMERTLQVLDYAILVISGTDGVQAHTYTLWKLLQRCNIPVFLFINKMDISTVDKSAVLLEIQRHLSGSCVDFSENSSLMLEQAAMTDENLLDEFLDTGTIKDESLAHAVAVRSLFPCYFGSALKLDGVEQFLDGIEKFTVCPRYPTSFGARVYKITRDSQGARITHMKITGGCLHVKDILENGEKIEQLRIYSGEKFKPVSEACAGTICAAAGLSETLPGDTFGFESKSPAPVLEPVLTYRVILPDGCDVHDAFVKLRQLEEEDPQLHIVWNPQLRQIHVQLMGQVQLDVLKDLISQRFGIDVGFGTGSIVYKETIVSPVEGVGHFEPLRHYAEVHLLLEPLERGRGLIFDSTCPEDVLDKNWQRLILTHLHEKTHLGVLTGSPITDMHITLIAGRAHAKHTEGGDFRQATYRAVRNGLMKAQSLLLEPYFSFRLEVPAENIGRAMTDIQQRSGEFSPPETEDGMSVLTGIAPVSEMLDYASELGAYTKGRGRIFLTHDGYRPCHNQQHVIEQCGYSPEADVENTPDSVFCSHGAGHTVKWDEVEKYMHIESPLNFAGRTEVENEQAVIRRNVIYSGSLEEDRELQRIFERTYGTVRGTFIPPKEPAIKSTSELLDKIDIADEFLLVDGYNVIFSWDELKNLAKDNLDLARQTLINILVNYQGYRKNNVILVYDAYRVVGGTEHIEKHGGLYVVYTRQAEIADTYIEKVTSQLGRHYNVRVVTSDGLEQCIVLGHGALRVPARTFLHEVRCTNAEIDSIIKKLSRDMNKK